MAEKLQHGALALIKVFFGLTMDEAKQANSELTEQDKLQLGSAIARKRGVTQDELKFQLVEY